MTSYLPRPARFGVGRVGRDDQSGSGHYAARISG